MSKKFVNQYCVHCLGYFEELTEDHIFPRSWYPDSTPQNMEKWVAPACFDCNNKLGKIENELYQKVAICINPEDIAASGVAEKAVQMLLPFTEENKRDRGRKEAALKQILHTLKYTHKMPNSLMKNFGPGAGVSGESMLVNISIPDLLDPVTKKIIRGLEFKLMGKLININRNINIIHLPDSTEVIALELTQLNNILGENGYKINRGPGFVVSYAKDIYGSMLYHVMIWGKWEIWAAVSGVGLKI